MAQAGSAPGADSHWLRSIVKVISVVLAALAAVVASVGYLWVKPLRLLLQEPIPPDVSVEDVHFPSRDGTRLHGLLMDGWPGCPALLLCHGYFKSLAEPFELACELNRVGYQVLLIDFRACGLSDGRFTTLGHREVLDVLGAVDYLRLRLGELPIGVLGISMGAVAAIMAATECPHIKALVVDSPYAELESVIGKKLADYLHLPLLVPLGWASISFGEWISQGNVAAIRAVDYVGRLGPRPLLFIHGELDDYVPSDHPQRLLDAANEPKELWLVPGSGHAMARLDHPQEYVQRVQAFFGRYLASA
jgi:pimeloyl-ACP methyl ester carboxylesterase